MWVSLAKNKDDETFAPEGCILFFSNFAQSITEDLDCEIGEEIIDAFPLASSQWGIGEFSWRFVLTKISENDKIE